MDHTDFVWNVLMTFVETEDDKRRIVEHITNVYKLSAPSTWSYTSAR